MKSGISTWEETIIMTMAVFQAEENWLAWSGYDKVLFILKCIGAPIVVSYAKDMGFLRKSNEFVE